MLRKVPEVTVLFWLIKILTTGMGETASDYLVTHFDPILAIACSLIVLAVALILQFKVRRYIAWIYWLAVLMVSIFGTMAADAVHVGLGVPYIASTIFFLAVLGAIFFFWHKKEGTLSIHSITTRRREIFYWATVLTTFALGTAAGDMTATAMNLGYFVSGIVFLILIILPAIGYWKFRLNAIFAFWFAYILTRPLGASFSDWAAVSHARGGLDYGTGPISLVLLIIIVLLVGYLAMTQKDVERTSVAK